MNILIREEILTDRMLVPNEKIFLSILEAYEKDGDIIIDTNEVANLMCCNETLLQKYIKKFKDEGRLTTRKEGRRRIISLLKKGVDG